MVSIEQQQAVIRQSLGSGAINVFGRPFAGKDVQCLRLARWLDAPVLSGGDILRKRDDLPPQVREDLHAGLLVARDDYLRIVTPYLAQPDFEGRPLVLSSVGRYHGEEISILQATKDAGHPVWVAVELVIDEDVVWKRWRKSFELLDRGHRYEDAEEALRTRFVEFDAKTQPVLDFYRQSGLLVTLDGNKDPDEVEREVLAALYRRAIQ